MKRRYKALIAVVLPVIIVAIIKRYYPLSYNILLGYIVAVAIVFKSSILSFWLVSKLKIISFLKSLTILQALSIAVKRWFLDNVVSKWLNKYLFKYIKEPILELIIYYKRVSFKSKIKNILAIFLPIGLVAWIMYITNGVYNFAIFVELKVIIIGFFKALWLLLRNIFSFLSGSWFAPVLEVFALSWLLDIIERVFGKNNVISRFFNYIGNFINAFLERIGLFKERHIEPIVDSKIIKKSQSFGEYIANLVKSKKISDEFLYFDNFRNIILKGHINAYYSFDGMEKIFDKKKLYTIINKKTNDNIDIIGFVSRNGKGDLIEESFDNDYYHDIFLLKGIASNKEYGVKEHLDDQIDYTDFWILNTSSHPVNVRSISNNFEAREIGGNEMQLIKTLNHIDFKDIIFEYKNIEANPTPID